MSKEVPQKCHCCDEGNYKEFSSIDTYKCDQCDHIYRHYNEDVTEFHEGDAYRDGQFDEEKQSFKDLHPILRAERAVRCQRQLFVVKSYIKQDESLMDLATGKGFFLEEAKLYYKNLKASDLHRVAVSHNAITNPEVEIILSDVLEMDESVAYDGVVAFDVLEHVDDANKFAEKVYKISNKYLILQVPCHRPLPPPNEGAFDGHVHYFSEKSIEALFCKNNFFSKELVKLSGPGVLAGGPEMIAVFKNTKNE